MRFLSLNNRQLNGFIVLLSAIALLVMFKYRFSNDNYKRVISGDGKGYYAYLPAVFIYHDLSFSFYYKNIENSPTQTADPFLINNGGGKINKFTCGEAVLLLPFFALAAFFSWLIGQPVDGYNEVFQLFCALGSLFYFICGLFLTKKLLHNYKISNNAIAFGLLALTFGTNILNYTVYECTMSHAFSFFAVASHVYTVKKFFDSPSLKTILFGGITLGLIILIRPVNLIIVFAYPFLAGEKNLFHEIKTYFNYFLIAGACALSVIFIQLLVWKIETGHFFVYSYKEEGFYYNRLPHFWDYLFSFRRGAFIYSPALFLSLIGFWKMRKEKRSAFFLFSFLVLVIFVHSAWWSWYYGDGFGERPLIDFYVFFALLFAVAFEKANTIRLSLIGLLAIFIFLHQVFFYQYTKNIIHPYTMNFEKFKHIFLKTSDKYSSLFISDPEDFYHPKGILVCDSAFANLTDTNAVLPRHLWYNKNNIRQGSHFEISNDYPFVYQIPVDTTWFHKVRYAEISFDFMQPNPDSAAAYIVTYATINRPDRTTSYYNCNPIADKTFNKAMEWNHIFDRIKIGTPTKTDSLIGIYLLDIKKNKLFIKNLSIKITEAKR